jgi:hypothetical protein
MKRVCLVALSGAIATATMAFAVGDASAQYRGRAVGVAAYDNVYAPGVYAPGVDRRTARRAYRQAAYTGVGLGADAGWNNAMYRGAPGYGAAAVAAGAPAAANEAGYDAYAAYGGNYGSFGAGTYRRTGELYAPAVQTTRAGARYIAAAARDTTGRWTQYPTRGEYARGYVASGQTGYYGPQCNPLLDIGCY